MAVSSEYFKYFMLDNGLRLSFVQSVYKKWLNWSAPVLMMRPEDVIDEPIRTIAKEMCYVSGFMFLLLC